MFGNGVQAAVVAIFQCNMMLACLSILVTSREKMFIVKPLIQYVNFLPSLCGG